MSTEQQPTQKMSFSSGGILLPVVPTQPGNPADVIKISASGVKAGINSATGNPTLSITFEIQTAELYDAAFIKVGPDFETAWNQRRWAFLAVDQDKNLLGSDQFAVTINNPRDTKDVDIQCTFSISGGGKINQSTGF